MKGPRNEPHRCIECNAEVDYHEGLSVYDDDGNEAVVCQKCAPVIHGISKAVVINHVSYGFVLHHTGTDIAQEIAEYSADLEDLTLSNAPMGISIWEGVYDGADTDGCRDPDGRFRPPDADEWDAIRNNRSPWEESPSSGESRGARAAMKVETLAKIKKLCLTDTFTSQAFKAYNNQIEAVCAALIMHAADKERLVQEKVALLSAPGAPMNQAVTLDLRMKKLEEDVSTLRDSVTGAMADLTNVVDGLLNRINHM